LSIPNLITLARILLVPIVVWTIASGAMLAAFVLFMLAGISDAVDGFLAKRFHMTTVLGAYLDPLADKALIVSIYLTLGIKAMLQEAAALASLTLFIGMIAIWSQVIGSL
jgi:cardiolipin synthase